MGRQRFKSTDVVVRREWSIPEKPCSWSQHMTKRAAVSAQEAPVLILFWLRAEPENLSQRCSHGARQRGAAARLAAWTAPRPGRLGGRDRSAVGLRQLLPSDPTLVGSLLEPGTCSSHHCHRGQWIFGSLVWNCHRQDVFWDFLWIWNGVCVYILCGRSLGHSDRV